MDENASVNTIGGSTLKMNSGSILARRRPALTVDYVMLTKAQMMCTYRPQVPHLMLVKDGGGVYANVNKVVEE